MIEDASEELTAVESAVGTARHVLDVAAATERLGTRFVARVRTALIVSLIVVATLGVAYALRASRGRRTAASDRTDEEQSDVTVADDVG